ncbi:uncharacterized protein EV154DRAFT_483563 [Mucor mucedo]|uniref:uncharacterized protein n=1 Tax=Mucor mucedo TaxID=29922 RepID=UPI00222031BB|nr:uncharacterized protein EV154DRAFT_483563 [Mucor mucedo]KAI7889024.1 hypothetical protein EV154DRAFT_483563 [Mucor mucedo]
MCEKMNGFITKSLRKLALCYPRKWDRHISTILYSYRIRAHQVLGISLFKLLYVINAGTYDQDPIVKFGRTLGLERLMYIQDVRDDLTDKFLDDYPVNNNTPRFSVRDLVLKRDFVKKNSLQGHYLQGGHCLSLSNILAMRSQYKNNTEK